MNIKSNALFAALASLGITGASQAGTIYTTQASFNAAVAGYSNVWVEDFGGYSLPISNPLTIAGGQAEVSGFGVTSVLFQEKSWLGSTGGPTSIQGPGDTSLDLAAISFNFGSGASDGQQVSFNLVGGGSNTSATYTAAAFAAPVDFIGWIGGSGEGLMDISFALEQVVILDNISGYVVPIPAAVWLFGSGLIGLIGMARRKAHA